MVLPGQNSNPVPTRPPPFLLSLSFPFLHQTNIDPGVYVAAVGLEQQLPQATLLSFVPVVALTIIPRYYTRLLAQATENIYLYI